VSFNKTNVNELKNIFPHDWVEELYEDYKKIISQLPSIAFFSSPANWVSNRKMGEINDYFKGMLYSCNICILDYVIKNKDNFKDFQFLDYGGGVGILSVFLQKIGIKCDIYDNFSQLNNEILSSSFFEKYNITPPTSNILIFNNCDVLTNSGIPVYYNEEKTSKNGTIFPETVSNHKFNYLFLDTHYLSRCKLRLEEYNLVHKYGNFNRLITFRRQKMISRLKYRDIIKIYKK